MCIIAACPPLKRPTKEALRWGFYFNSHGAGMAWNHNNKLHIKKGFFSFDEFYAEYVKIPIDSTIVVHFRYTSAGETNKSNCHPFRINKNTAVAHNGTIWEFVGDPTKTKKSDTALYVENVLKPLFNLGGGFLRTAGANFLLEKSLGKGKMVFLNHRGQFGILNESAGVWDEEMGCWFSNDGYKEFSKYNGTTLPQQFWFDFKEEGKEEEEEEVIEFSVC
jgi:Glutamine amidotransferases class-II